MKYRYKAKCSQCGRGFYANTRSDLLSKLRKHLWSKHGDWMRRRIKKGLKASRPGYHAPGNPFAETVKKILNPSWTGFAERAVIEKITGRPYEQVRAEALDAFVAELFQNLTPGKKSR